MSQPRNVAIFIFDDVEVLDFAGPFEVFSVAGRKVDPTPFNTYTVGLSERTVSARGGLLVQPHYTLANCPAPDLLLIPGGNGTRELLDNAPLSAWIHDQSKRVELLLSVCTGALLLAKAGLLVNYPATTHHSAFDELAEISPTTLIQPDKRFVETAHGKIVTSGGISAGIDMSLFIVEKLLGAAAKASVVDNMEYQWHLVSATSAQP